MRPIRAHSSAMAGHSVCLVVSAEKVLQFHRYQIDSIGMAAEMHLDTMARNPVARNVMAAVQKHSSHMFWATVLYKQNPAYYTMA